MAATHRRPSQATQDSSRQATVPQARQPFNLRRVLRVLASLTAAAGAAAMANEGRSAQAANGQPLVLGQVNTATGDTELDDASVNGLIVTNSTGNGVYGTSSAAGGIGVLGSGSANGFGIYGTDMGSGGTGVAGSASNGNGVYGTSSAGNGIGVYGNATGSGSYGVYGSGVYAGVSGSSGSTIGIGTAGVATGTYATGVEGVSGTASTGFVQNKPIGVAGIACPTNAFVGAVGPAQPTGVFGYSPDPNGYGVSGVASGTSGYGVLGTALNGGTAASFGGPVFVHGDLSVSGNLTVQGAASKSAAVKAADGKLRRLYCMESPESWFEDFGTAQLTGGSATVQLAQDFAGVVRGDDYRVFPVPRGDCKGLFISSQTPSGFTVRELQGGTSNVAFDYRVVARRKDIPGPRMEEVQEMAPHAAVTIRQGGQPGQATPPTPTPPVLPPLPQLPAR